MSTELRAMLLYLGWFQLILIWSLANVPGLIYLWIVNSIILVLIIMVFGGWKMLFDKKQNKEDKKTETELRSAFQKRSRFMFQHIIYSWTFYLLALLFLFWQLIGSARRRILISIMIIVFMFMSFLVHLYFDKVYFIRKLMTPIDYVLWISVMIFWLCLFLFKNWTWFIQYWLASLAALLFVWSVAKFWKLLYKNNITRFVFVKLYIFILSISIVLFILREYTIVSGWLSANLQDKLNFIQQDVENLINELGYWEFHFSKKNWTDSNNKQNTKSQNTWNKINMNLSWSLLSWQKNTLSHNTKNIGSGVFSNSWNIINPSNLSWSNQTWNQNLLFSWKNLEDFVTRRELLKYLFNQNELITWNYNLKYISKSDPDYKYFATAYKYRLIWATINPDNKILCQTYIVVLWLKQHRDIKNYNNIFKSYRQEAQKKWVLNWCKRNEFVKYKNLVK